MKSLAHEIQVTYRTGVTPFLMIHNLHWHLALFGSVVFSQSHGIPLLLPVQSQQCFPEVLTDIRKDRKYYAIIMKRVVTNSFFACGSGDMDNF